MRVLIIGAGSQGAVVADALLRGRVSGGAADLGGFLDDSPTATSPLPDFPVLGGLSQISRFDHDAIVVAIGDNTMRRRVMEDLMATGERMFSVRHPFTSIAESASIGDGTMIAAGTIVAPAARIGRGVILNTRSSIDHDDVIGDYAHISCGATLGGHVIVGDESFIGLGASVSSDCRIGARTIIGAGAVVVRDIPDDVVAFGVPARIVRRR